MNEGFRLFFPAPVCLSAPQEKNEVWKASQKDSVARYESVYGSEFCMVIVADVPMIHSFLHGLEFSYFL